MDEKDIEIRPSTIEGQGVFAKRSFQKGETVLVWDVSHLLSTEEFAQLSDSEKKYVAKLGHRLIAMQPLAKYVNHSCDPNTVPMEPGKDVALRDIAVGEEITSDYGRNGATGKEIVCNCGSKNCIKTIIP